MGELTDKIIILVGEKIREIRISQSISQHQLAYESGLSREFINKIERGKCNISIKKLAMICEALNIAPEKIFESIKNETI